MHLGSFAALTVLVRLVTSITKVTFTARTTARHGRVTQTAAN
jgi:hypothetical protein